MTDVIKIERSLLASFLVDVTNCINKPVKETSLDVSNALNKIEMIQKVIEEQDSNSIKKNKFKQTSLL